MRAMRDPETQALTPLVEAEVQRALDAQVDGERHIGLAGLARTARRKR